MMTLGLVGLAVSHVLLPAGGDVRAAGLSAAGGAPARHPQPPLPRRQRRVTVPCSIGIVSPAITNA